MSDDPTGGLTARWDRLVAGMEATADGYREAGYETVAVRPTDVSVVPPPEFGLVALVGSDTFQRVADLAARHDFAAGDRQASIDAFEDVVLVALAVESAGDAAVVLVPLYYQRPPDGEGELRNHDGELFTRIRNPAGDDVVTFSHEEPAAFLPAEPFDA